MAAYDFTVSSAAFHAAQACDDRDAIRLSHAIEFLTENPRSRADFVGPNCDGRLIPWKKVGKFAVGYLPDHARKMIHVLEVRQVLG